MATEFKELNGLEVAVDDVVFTPHLDAPPDRPYPFVYFITITNNSSLAVTIKGRKWVVTDHLQGTVVVEGDGVVGKCPRLEPGEHFSYNSYHVVGGNSVATGAFIGLTDDGQPVITLIPKFKMNVP